METIQPNQILDENVAQVMQSLPPLIRNYILDKKYAAIAMGLMTKYKLRIDQGGVLELNLLLLLMGINNPSEFTQALVEKAKLDQQTVNSIVQDVNNLIFVPLRAEEEKGGMTAVEVRPSPEILKVEPQIQPAAPKAEPEPTTHFKLENRIPLPSPTSQPQKSEKSIPFVTMSQGSLPPKVLLPRPATLGEVVRSVLAVPKPIENSKLLEDHEEPHIEINKILVPTNLPGMMPPIEIPHPEEIKPAVLVPEIRPSPELPKIEPQIQPVAPIAPVAPKPIVVTPITSYSSDPYREPIDEPPTE